jgi:peptidoglycan/xylan/chitin deacetylase (PgdA/CDA1 family)
MAQRRTPVVRVIYMHATPAHRADVLRRYLSWLQREYDVIDFATFAQMWSAPFPQNGKPAALLTFDDGLRSNFDVAAPLLEERGLRGLFFVVPQFSLASGADAERFYAERIHQRRGYEPSMTPQQIAELAARGHAIGNHTLTHAKFTRTDPAEYTREIVDSARMIESWIGGRVDAFAWPFFWDSITPEAHRIAVERHRYCFAPCPGRVDPSVDSPRLLWRTGVEAHFGAAEGRFQCSPLADRATAWRRRELARRLTAPDTREAAA